MKCFSSRTMLLELIYELHSFKEEELIAKYKQLGNEESDENNVADYLNQLTQINILRQRGDQFVVQSSLKE